MDLDLIIRNGTVVTVSDIYRACDIGIKNGKIVAMGIDLPVKDGTETLDAEGAYVTPGGVDSHVHLSQFYDASISDVNKTIPTDGTIPDPQSFTGDTYDTGTKGAIAGGTTTIISFASQFRGDTSLVPVITEYHKLAEGKAYCDYSFHVIITNPSAEICSKDLPKMVEDFGITSVKIYMTYKSLMLKDYEILDVMFSARNLGITTMVHAENADVIDWMTKYLEDKQLTHPHHHGTVRPPPVEAEATYRAITLSELMDTPILLVHVSGERATNLIRDAKTAMLPVYGETCPQYLFLRGDSMRKDGFEGAKYVCSPPLRDNAEDQEAIWRGIQNGTFTTLSSDHSPIKFNHPKGKLLGLLDHTKPYGHFKYIPNGLPGIETRVPLLFTDGVISGRITPQKFVEVTSTGPAQLYGLKSKGTLAPGFDADITVWYPQEKFTPFKLTNEMLHHSIDYTPFEGYEFKNWPRYTLVRGKLVFSEGKVLGEMGYGKFQKRVKSLLPGPRGTFMNHIRP